jgi:hypothetical protein
MTVSHNDQPTQGIGSHFRRGTGQPWYYRRWLTLLLSPLGLVLISAGRLLIISNYNATTAVTIASSGGYLNTLLGSTIPLVPIFIPYVALLLLLFRQFMLSALAFVFAAFIAPTSLTLPISRSLAEEDTYQILNQITANRLITLTVAFVIVIIAYAYFHSWAEALATLLLLTAAVALLYAPVIRDLYLPHPLQAANSSERNIGPSFRHDASTVFSSTERYVIIAIIVVLVAIFIFSNLAAFTLGRLWLRNVAHDVNHVVSSVAGGGIRVGVPLIPGATTLVIALGATIAFFPYIYNIYPVPHRTEYYVGVLRTPWLPAEKLSLRGGRNYYGYTLSADQDWFTILLARTRKIVYVHTDDVLRRSVCETLSQRKIPVEPPLITTFYRKPEPVRACADRKYLLNSSGSTARTRSHGHVPTAGHPRTVPRGHTFPG